MRDEHQQPTTDELLETKARLVELWQRLPPAHQAIMLLVLLKHINDTDMSDWTREAIASVHTHSEQTQDFFPLPTVAREQLRALDIEDHALALLTDDDLLTIAARIQASYRHDEFWDELMLQVLAVHTEQLLREKRGTGSDSE